MFSKFLDLSISSSVVSTSSSYTFAKPSLSSKSLHRSNMVFAFSTLDGTQIMGSLLHRSITMHSVHGQYSSGFGMWSSCCHCWNIGVKVVNGMKVLWCGIASIKFGCRDRFQGSNLLAYSSLSSGRISDICVSVTGIHTEVNTIIVWCTFPPRGCHSDILSAHASWSAWITGCKECCGSWFMNTNFAGKRRASRNGDFWNGQDTVGIELVIKKLAKKRRKCRQLKFGSKCSNCSCVSYIA